jgi:hypothetical protein
VVEQETQDSVENIIRPDLDLECETLIVNFQKLTISSAGTSDTRDPEWISHNSTMCTRWQSILCKYSANILLREKAINAKEKTISSQITKIDILKKKSKLLDCKICYENICDVICFPCRHFIMCQKCFDSVTNIFPNICPLCRTNIQTHSNVFLA